MPEAIDSPNSEKSGGTTENPLPKISVVIPVYKTEKYLRECVESVLAQTFKDFELILVDDGSPNRCGEICDELAKKDPRIRVFHKENGGVTSARKLGVEKALAEWICFVDSDDLLLNNALKDLFEKATDDTDWVQGGWIKFREGEAPPTEDSSKCNVTYFDLIGLVENMLYSRPYPWGKLVRKRLFPPYVFEIPREIIAGEDSQMNLRAIANSPRNPKEISKKVYCYRIREDSVSMSHAPTVNYILRIYGLFLETLGKFPTRHRERIKYAISKKLYKDDICDMLRFDAPIKSSRKLVPIVRPVAKENLKNFFNYICLALGYPRIAQTRMKISQLLRRRETGKGTKTLMG